MFRAVSTLKSRYSYNRLHDEAFSSGALPEPGLIRVKTMPARLSGIPKELGQEAKSTTKRSKKNKSHPMFSLFNSRRMKMTSKPELARYMEYLKEGGRWDKGTTAPVIYYTN